MKTDASVFVDVTSRPDGAIVALASSYDRHGDARQPLQDAALALHRRRSLVRAARAAVRPDAPRRDGRGGAERSVAPLRVRGARRRSRPAGRRPRLDRRRKDVDASDARCSSRRSSRRSSPRSIRSVQIASICARRRRPRARPACSSATTRARPTARCSARRGRCSASRSRRTARACSAGGPDDGLYAGSADGAELVQVSGPKLKVQCLGQSGDVLWACSSEASGFIAGTSRNGGTSFEARLHLRDITGPLACAEGSAVAKECGLDWLKLKGELGVGTRRGVPARTAASQAAGPGRGRAHARPGRLVGRGRRGDRRGRAPAGARAAARK